MVCIYCGGATKVTNSRPRQKGMHVWRRRCCLHCQAVFSTQESVLDDTSLVVHKQGHYEPFSRDHLLIDVYDSLKHRKTALTDATALTDTILQKLSRHFHDGVITPSSIAEVTAGVLAHFDTAASVHYQAFHKT